MSMGMGGMMMNDTVMESLLDKQYERDDEPPVLCTTMIMIQHIMPNNVAIVLLLIHTERASAATE